MKIKQLRLRFFRNYEWADIRFEPTTVFLLGDNAQGKTNLLEAMYYLSTMRSFRTSDDIQLIQFDRDFAKLTLVFERDGRDAELEIVISRNGKYVTFNGQNVSKMSEIIGLFNAVVFCPADLKFLFGSPRDRRRFIDMELGKISPSYLHDLLLTQKLLKERNALLKLKDFDMKMLEVLTSQLIDVQIRIIKARSRFLALIEQEAREINQKLARDFGILSLEYQPCTAIESDDVMKNQLFQRYQESLDKDVELRSTQVGIHREDFVIKLDQLELQHYGSQGQRRSAVLAIKIGLLEVVRLRSKEYPVLLLDDVLSELDETHRVQLFRVIPKEVQVLVTATDISQAERKMLSYCDFYRVCEGVITKEE